MDGSAARAGAGLAVVVVKALGGDAHEANLLSYGVDVATEFRASEFFAPGRVKLKTTVMELAEKPIDGDGGIRF